MLARLVEFALTQRLLVLVVTAALVVAGVLAYRDLPIDAFPDVSSTQVKVIVKAPGMTPEEVEARITTPLELEFLGIAHKRMLRSTSKYAIADITLDFIDGTDLYWARQQVSERLATASRDLPPGVIAGLAPITTPLGEMLMFTIEGPGLSLAERRSLLDWTIRPALRTLPGVADVNALGGMVRAFEVVPDNGAMLARGITPELLRRAIETNNRNDGAGRIQGGEQALLVRTEGSVRTLEDLRAVVIANRGGVPVRVDDVATVRVGSLTRYGTVLQNGQDEAVQGLVLGLRGANARLVVEGVTARLAEIAPLLPKGATTSVFYNRGQLVERAVGTVQRALAEAIALVLVLLVVFLGNLRAALVVALMLPLAALGTFLLMGAAGMSANLMSLGGLAIAIGMLVDGAVVVVENVITQLASGGPAARLPRLHLVYRAVKDVTVPVASGVAIIIIVFLPLLTLQGLEGKLFVPVALTVVFALSMSLVLSLTAVPVLASLLVTKVSHREPWVVRQALGLYLPTLRWALAHPRPVIAASLLALVASGAVYTRIGKTFMPTLDEGDLIMQVEMLPSVSLAQAVSANLAIQKAVLARLPEVTRVVTRAGSDEIGLDPMGLNQADTFLVLKPRSQWRHPEREWLVDELRAVMADFPGTAYSFTQPIDMRVSEMLTGTRGDLAVKVFGPDLPTLNRLVREVVAAIRTVPGAEDVFSVKNEGVQYYRVEIDRLAAGRHGLSADELGDILRMQLEGQPLGVVLEPGRRTPLMARGADDVRMSPARFANLTIGVAGGASVPLAAVARLVRADGPVKVDRENAQRVALVQANVRGRDLVGFVAQAKDEVARRVTLPEGYRTAWGGQFENQQRAAARLAAVVPISLALIFGLLFFTFGSVRQAALVFTNIPLALIGGVFALWISGEYLSVPASVGFIALLGIAVLNGVVLVSHFNQLRDRGMPLEQVVVDGARRRLRPVLMTAFIAAFGLLPLVFATGPGSEIQRPLAIVVIGGLVSSTVLTLIVLPLLYRRFGAVGDGARVRGGPFAQGEAR